MDFQCSRPLVPDGIRVEQRDRLYLLLHPHKSRWVIVNGTGYEVAQLCDGQRTPANIADEIAREWGLEPTWIQLDVDACLEGLQRAGFLLAEQSVPEPSASPGGSRGWSLQLHITGRCNLRCRHCGVTTGPRHPDHLDQHLLLRVIDQALEAGADAIGITGGEPLLRKDCLDLLRHAAGRARLSLATNAMLIDAPTAAVLAELGVTLQISMDGATAETHDLARGAHAFNRAWQGIHHLVEQGAGSRVALNVTMMRWNLSEIPDIVRLATEKRLSGVRFAPVQRIGQAARHWAEVTPSREEYEAAYNFLYRNLGRTAVSVSRGLPGLVLKEQDPATWCRLGRLLVVDETGDIYPCSLLMAAEFRLGNVADTSLPAALASDRMRQIVTSCEQRKNVIEECRSCSWQNFCQASCPGAIWLQNGNWYATDGLCELRRQLYRDLIFGEGQAIETACVAP